MLANGTSVAGQGMVFWRATVDGWLRTISAVARQRMIQRDAERHLFKLEAKANKSHSLPVFPTDDSLKCSFAKNPVSKKTLKFNGWKVCLHLLMQL
ncbi:MAG: hypothetical protein SPI18_09595 [Prevotella sp.]|nr:hypothetical protein [Prevotella sp.]MDY6131513.1 hypothetical protein [Prevotella sp.]